MTNIFVNTSTFETLLKGLPVPAFHWHLPQQDESLFQNGAEVKVICESDNRTILGKIIGDPIPFSHPSGYAELTGDLFALWIAKK